MRVRFPLRELPLIKPPPLAGVSDYYWPSFTHVYLACTLYGEKYGENFFWNTRPKGERVYYAETATEIAFDSVYVQVNEWLHRVAIEKSKTSTGCAFFAGRSFL